MTRRLTHALAALYAVVALTVAHLAVRTWPASIPYALLLGGASVLLAVAIAHHAYSRDEVRAARADLERALRPYTTTQDTTVADLVTPCCETWWTTAGAPHTCTRKDHPA
ncbi:hypothetical protein ACSCBZ_24720 [Streptomyces niveiscabiei]|uniref:hypothetical protein n=1 Tax=Streptomyces niveiscabiei TaxID=164115 RepID=UPI0006EB669C|nr:hypothetical protein [Streptomyces niveiscabiei]